MMKATHTTPIDPATAARIRGEIVEIIRQTPEWGVGEREPMPVPHIRQTAVDLRVVCDDCPEDVMPDVPGERHCQIEGTGTASGTREPEDHCGPAIDVITVGWAADCFLRQHSQNVRYVSAWGAWIVWDGRRWARDESNKVLSMAARTVRSILGMLSTERDAGRREAIFRLARRLDSATGYTAIVETAATRDGVCVGPQDLDRDDWLFNVENGTIDLRTGNLQPHDRAHYITKLAPVTYNPEAESPLWLKFLGEVFAGNGGLMGFVQRLLGHCLTGDIREHILPIFYGSGRNGKNTLLDFAIHILGDYASVAPGDFLSVKRSDEHPTEVADCCGKRLVAASESEEGRQLRVQLVKRITGDEFIKARYMRCDYFTFRRTHKTILVTNNAPSIHERSVAIWERVKLVPFSVSFAGREDRTLPARLRGEASGVLNWLLVGCMAWQRDGLGEPDEVRAATAGYRDEQDVLGPFLDDCCLVTPGARVSRSTIWATYSDWARRTGERSSLDRNGLYGRLRERGFGDIQMREHGKKAHGFAGVGISGGTDDPTDFEPDRGDDSAISCGENGSSGTGENGPGVAKNGVEQVGASNSPMNTTVYIREGIIPQNAVPACSAVPAGNSEQEIPPGWTIDAWRRELLRMADVSRAANPEQADEYQRQAEALGEGTGASDGW